MKSAVVFSHNFYCCRYMNWRTNQKPGAVFNFRPHNFKMETGMRRRELTEEQKEIIKMVNRGMTTREIREKRKLTSTSTLPGIIKTIRRKGYDVNLNKIGPKDHLFSPKLVRDAKLEGLSPREKQVLDLLKKGKDNKKIAEILGLTQNNLLAIKWRLRKIGKI